MWLSTLSLVLTRARNYKHKDNTHVQNGIFDSILDTSSPQPNDKQDGGRYCFSYVCLRSGSKWPMIGPRPCAYACAYVDPVFTCQSYDISISTSTRWTNLSIFLVLMLMLMSTQFSLAYTHVLGFLWLCLCLCASENQALVAVIEIALPQPFLCLNTSPIQYDFCGRPKAIYYDVSIALGYLPLHSSNKRSVSPVFVSQR